MDSSTTCRDDGEFTFLEKTIFHREEGNCCLAFKRIRSDSQELVKTTNVQPGAIEIACSSTKVSLWWSSCLDHTKSTYFGGLKETTVSKTCYSQLLLFTHEILLFRDAGGPWWQIWQPDKHRRRHFGWGKRGTDVGPVKDSDAFGRGGKLTGITQLLAARFEK